MKQSMSKSDKKPDAPRSGLPSQRLNRKAVPCIDGVTPEETALNFANLTDLARDGEFPGHHQSRAP